MTPAMIRPAIPGDAIGICRVHQRAVRLLCRGDYTAPQIEAWVGPRRPEDYIAALVDGERLWVASAAGRVVGFAGVKGHELTACYVDPDQGRRGIGQRLLRAVGSVALTEGAACLVVMSSLTALEFYHRAGYGADQPRTHRLRSGMTIPCVRLAKRLV